MDCSDEIVIRPKTKKNSARCSVDLKQLAGFLRDPLYAVRAGSWVANSAFRRFRRVAGTGRLNK
jgi:hypothetical protein